MYGERGKDKPMIAIIDYDAGNTFNVQKAFHYIGLETILTADPAVLLRADGVVLPGVGAYASAMATLKERNLIDTIYAVVDRNIPLLGICLGMQLLFDESEEYGPTAGLGLIPGIVKAIPNDGHLRVPHMGWNQNTVHNDKSVFRDIHEEYTYFVHSYYVDTDKQFITTTVDYGISIPGIVEKDFVYGMQFHPEKSGVVGLNLLRTFGDIVQSKYDR